MNLKYEAVWWQGRAGHLLKGFVKKGRVPHAILISGRPGVGKRLLAQAFASALMCFDPVSGEACSTCSSCRRLRADMNPDLLNVQPEGQTIKIDQIRKVIAELPFTPHMSKNRVIICENVEKLGDEAANALLKSIEEPPPHNVFVLMTTNVYALLPTIRSRCCIITAQPIPYSELFRIAQDVGISPEDNARLYAFLAQGSRDALSWWLDKAHQDQWSTIDGWIRRVGKVPMQMFFNEVRALFDEKDPIEETLQLLKLWLILFIRNAIRSNRLVRDEWLDVFEFIEEGEQALKFNINKLLLMEEIGFLFREELYEENHWSQVS